MNGYRRGGRAGRPPRGRRSGLAALLIALHITACGGGGHAAHHPAAVELELVSRSESGAVGSTSAFDAALSSDGRFVALRTAAALSAGDTNGLVDIYVRDRLHDTTTLASLTSVGTATNGDSSGGVVSGDGRIVAFTSDATNLVPFDSNGNNDVFVRDLGASTTTRIQYGGTQPNGGSDSPRITADGRYVVFETLAANLSVSDTNADYDIFRYDVTSGALLVASADASTTLGNSGSVDGTISDDGRYVAFASVATNLVAGDTNGVSDIFVKDMTSGAIRRVDLGPGSVEADGQSYSPRISGDGHHVAFISAATNLVGSDTNGHADAFVVDLVSGIVVRASRSTSGAEADHDSSFPALSRDGRLIVFASAAGNLVAGDTNALSDIFVRDTLAGTTLRVDVGPHGEQSSAGARSPALSPDGSVVGFETQTALVPDDANGVFDVYVGPVSPAAGG